MKDKSIDGYFHNGPIISLETTDNNRVQDRELVDLSLIHTTEFDSSTDEETPRELLLA